jgi:hypothetical protein
VGLFYGGGGGNAWGAALNFHVARVSFQEMSDIRRMEIPSAHKPAHARVQNEWNRMVSPLHRIFDYTEL